MRKFIDNLQPDVEEMLAFVFVAIGLIVGACYVTFLGPHIAWTFSIPIIILINIIQFTVRILIVRWSRQG